MSQISPLVEVALGTVLLVVSTLVHGVGMYVTQRAFDLHWPPPSATRLHRQVILGGLILLMLATHLVELVLWTACLLWTGAVVGLRDAFYYAAVTYTTLGYEDIRLSVEWRLLSPIMAMSGMFAFGWTTGVLVSIFSQARTNRSPG